MFVENIIVIILHLERGRTNVGRILIIETRKLNVHIMEMDPLHGKLFPFRNDIRLRRYIYSILLVCTVLPCLHPVVAVDHQVRRLLKANG